MSGGLHQITGNTKLTVHCFESGLQLLKSAPGQHQKSPAPYLPGRHKISNSITNKIGSGQIYIRFLGYLPQHARPWFTTAATIFGTVGAINHSINSSAIGGNLCYHALVNIIYNISRYYTSTDNSLVSNHDNGQAQLAQRQQTVFSLGQESKLLPALYVVRSIFTNYAIPI
jgi:hypothetical protein